jgi:hypothetical protein
MNMQLKLYISVLMLAYSGALFAGPAELEFPKGAAIYTKQCVDCHGARGEGVKDEYDKPLVGDRGLSELARIIHKTMPDEDPKLCRDQEAEEVAKYINKAFYGPDAIIKHQRAHIEFARLTVKQYEQAAADLMAEFLGRGTTQKREGLRGTYYTKRDRKKVFERVDPQVDFDWQSGTPDNDKFDREAFAVHWRGSILTEQTGVYEFAVQSENGFELWVNSGSENKLLIDGYVAAGPDAPARRARIRLLGGRAYPIKLEFFKFKDNTASIELRWKPPHKVESVIPQRNLSPDGVPFSFVANTAFPPDDSSVGYPRGTSVSKAWDEATTFAAIEVLDTVMLNLDRIAKTSKEDPKRAEMLKQFAERFAERAFRRPLTPEQKQIYLHTQFEQAADADQAIKRVVLLVLKSPHFLYPALQAGALDGYTVASRLSFGLWDSLPDENLLRAAREGRLSKPDDIRRQAERMLKDPRARAKLDDFFHAWLHMSEAEDIAKDSTLFPGFDAAVMSDLRTSLQLFVEEVVWNDSSDFRQLMLANYMYLNKRLADYYDVKEETGEAFQKVSFDPKMRSGVLTHPYLLSTLAYHQSTSPIHRGVFITRNMLGRSLNPPPEAQLFVDSQFNPEFTMREKVAQLTRAPNCMTCHSVINPLGFSLEHYDAVGRYRTHEKKKPIQSESDYETGEGKTIRLRDARDLAEYAAQDASAQHGFMIQLFNQLAKQPIQAYGSHAIIDLHESFKKSDYHIQKLLVEMAVVAALHEREEP